jgi:hypothetical protein
MKWISTVEIVGSRFRCRALLAVQRFPQRKFSNLRIPGGAHVPKGTFFEIAFYETLSRATRFVLDGERCQDHVAVLKARSRRRQLALPTLWQCVLALVRSTTVSRMAKIRLISLGEVP